MSATAGAGSDATKEDDEGARRKAVSFNLEPVVFKAMPEVASVPDGLPQLMD